MRKKPRHVTVLVVLALIIAMERPFLHYKKSKDPISQSMLRSLRGGPDTLDFADDEVDSIAQLTGGQKWLNERATKSNFLENVENCRILHLTLHTVETDPHDPTGLAILFSKLSETDANLLTSSELYSLDLNSELAVVSSCQSGFGQIRQGEGTLSLGRAMALAGCRASVVNLWKADDAVSRDLMISFYKNLKLGQTKDRALQNAVRFYLQNTLSERAGPQFWANFSAIGEMEAVFFEEEKTPNWHWWLGAGIGLCFLFLALRYSKNINEHEK
jgi:CHAT domain-containing protein